MYIALLYIVLCFSMLYYLSLNIHPHPLLSHYLKTSLNLKASKISKLITSLTESTFLPESLSSHSPSPFVHAKTSRFSGEKPGPAP